GNSALAYDPPPGILLAQEFEAGDAYDPFADYSEFEATEEEEADINFFRNGRFFTVGFLGGYQMFTETLGDLYDPAFDFGLYLSYFFDLRFAIQLQFTTGDHNLSFTSPGGVRVNGNVSVTTLGILLKYYLNTQNVTKGIADLNPFVFGGFNQITRTATVEGEDAFAKEGPMGFEFGSGIELPMMRDKMYIGFQASYTLVTFSDENSEITLATGERTGIFPTGDILKFNAVLGINF
ncbi:MAG: hypothetical protein AAF202_11515, partial [Pseudomonadota bacterium]